MNRPMLVSSRIVPFIIVIALVIYYSGIVSTDATTINPKYKSNFDFHEVNKKLDRFGKSFSSWLKNDIDTNLIPSVSVGIVINNKLVFNTGFEADINSRFKIASLTKTFTAILILQLVEEGAFKLDVPLNKYFPDFVIGSEAPGSRPVTMRHLLSHSSGITGGEYGTLVINNKYISYPKQSVATGRQYSYSNRAFVVLKELLEGITGKSYAALLKERIFSPLEMTSSTGENSNGTGGIVTTITDLAKYASMLINRGMGKDGRIISEETFDKMLTPVVRMYRGNLDYHCSCSWEINKVNGRVDSFYKAGRWFGAASILEVFPDRKAAIMFLANPQDFYSGNFYAWRSRITSRLRNMLRNTTKDPLLFGKFFNNNMKLLKKYFVGHLWKLKSDKSREHIVTYFTPVGLFLNSRYNDSFQNLKLVPGY